MKLWSLRSAYNNYEIIVVTASLGVTRRRSLCRHVLLTAVWLNTTIGGSNKYHLIFERLFINSCYCRFYVNFLLGNTFIYKNFSRTFDSPQRRGDAILVVKS